MPKKVETVGKTFGLLTVVNELPERSNSKRRHYRCRCACGGWALCVRGDNLRGGRTRSCGCENKRVLATHGLSGQSGNSHYSRWRNIKNRTGNQKAHNYLHYGGRGISFHKPWADSFILFKSWLDDNLGPCPEGWTLDRIDNDGDYEAGNLRWASAKTQRHNQRKAR